MPIDYAAVDAELGPDAHNVSRICFTKFRFIPTYVKEELRRSGLWDDLIQETYLTAWESYQNGLSVSDTRHLIESRLGAFFRAYGYRRYRHRYYQPEKVFSSVAKDGEHEEELLATAHAAPPKPIFSQEDLGEKIMAMLKEHPEGIPKNKLYSRLGISAQEIEWQCRPLIEQGLVVEVKRESFRGRPLGPLLVAVQPGPTLPELPVPSAKLSRTEVFERIRQAHLVEGKSIREIARESHHDRRTIREALGRPFQKRNRHPISQEELKDLLAEVAEQDNSDSLEVSDF